MSLINVGEFITVQKIGQGTNPVHKVKSILTDKEYAMKTVRRKEYEKHVSDIEELLCIMKCDHPNIIKIEGYNIRQMLKDYNNGEYVLCYLMKLMKKTLQNEIEDRKKVNNPFTYEEVLRFLSELLDAFEYLQRDIQIAHRDIKPENILLDENNSLILSDFNSSFINSLFKTKAHTMVGSPFYLAPELRKAWDLKEEESMYLEYDPWRSDVYSLGVTLCDICELDIARKEPVETKLKTVETLYGSAFSNLIRKMLEPDMEKRVDFLELRKSPELMAVFAQESHPKGGLVAEEVIEQKPEDTTTLAYQLLQVFEKKEAEESDDESLGSDILEIISKVGALENEFKLLNFINEKKQEELESEQALLNSSTNNTFN